MTVWAFFFSFSFLSQEATPKQKRAKHKHSNQHPESGMCATGDTHGKSGSGFEIFLYPELCSAADARFCDF